MILAYSTSHLARWSYTGVAKPLSLDLGLNKGALGLFAQRQIIKDMDKGLVVK